MRKLPVLKAFGASVAFILSHGRDLARIVWAPFVVLVVGGFLIGLGFGGARGLASGGGASGALAGTALAAPLIVAEMALGIYVYLVISAGVLKLLVRGERPARPFYLGFGDDEFKLLGNGLISLLISIAAGFVAAIIATLVSAALLAAHQDAAANLLLWLVFFFIILWAGARLSLAAPATIDLRRVGVAPAWSQARGTTIPLILFWFIWTAIYAACMVGYLELSSPGYLALMSSAFDRAGDPQAARQIMEQAAELPQPLGFFGPILSGILSIAVTVIGAVASGVAWRLLTDQDKGGAR